MNIKFILKEGNKIPKEIEFKDVNQFLDYVVTNGPFRIKKSTRKLAELIKEY